MEKTRTVHLVHDLDPLALRMAHVRASIVHGMHNEDPRRGPAQHALAEALRLIEQVEEKVAEAERMILRPVDYRTSSGFAE